MTTRRVAGTAGAVTDQMRDASGSKRAVNAGGNSNVRPASSAVEYRPNTCQTVTKGGKPCPNPPDQTGLCFAHRPRLTDASEKAKRFGFRRKNAEK